MISLKIRCSQVGDGLMGAVRSDLSPDSRHSQVGDGLMGVVRSDISEICMFAGR